MTYERLTDFLAERVMGWTVSADRFLTGKRGWMPRWRFQPAEKLEDAFWLLDRAEPTEYSISADYKGNVQVRVRIGGAVGEARENSKARAITYALARAIGMEVEQ